MSNFNETVSDFGQCPSDVPSFVVLVSAMSLMAAGNVLLLLVLVAKFRNERMELLILNQVVVDLLYTAIFPLVILDARREIRSWKLFFAFKVLEDSLLTLSCLAVVYVAIFKHIQISWGLRFRDGCSRTLIVPMLLCSWTLTPIAFSIRNSYFICTVNHPCAASYYKCIASYKGTGEISSITFYLGCALLLILININFVRYALVFQTQTTFINGNECQGRRIMVEQRNVERRLRHLRIILYPLMTGIIALFTITPFWISMALCQAFGLCKDEHHSLFYLMRLHGLFNPYATLLTYRRFRYQVCKVLCCKMAGARQADSSYAMLHYNQQQYLANRRLTPASHFATTNNPMLTDMNQRPSCEPIVEDQAASDPERKCTG